MTKKEILMEKLENLYDSELVSLWNDFCKVDSRQENLIYDLDDYTLDGVFESASEVLKNLGEFDYDDDYFAYDGYGYINSFSGALDTYSPVDLDMLVDWLEDNIDVADEYGLEEGVEE